MLRTFIVRSQAVLNGNLKRPVNTNLIRNVSVESTKRKRQYRITVTKSSKSQLEWQPTSTLTGALNINYQQHRNYASNLPAHTRVALPALSPTMESGTLISWEKKEGDRLNEGDLLAEIETDKATMGFETPEEGYLAKILIAAGTKNVPIGQLVCVIVENEADIKLFKDFKDDGSPVFTKPPAPIHPPHSHPPASAPTLQPPTISTPSAVPPPPVAASSGRVYASPMAKRLAEQRNIRLQGKGTGLFGSITASDLESLPGAAAAGGGTTPSTIQPLQQQITIPPGVSFVDIPITGIRSTIAKRLLQSKQTIPHYTLTVNINIDKILKLRERFNKRLEKDGLKLSLNDFIIKAIAVASKKVPEANSSWMDTVIRQFNSVDVSVAVATDRGLITPIVFAVESKGVVEISKTVKVLAAKARDGKLQPQEFQGGTISISNLGMFGISEFSAIINPPQSCILAVGATTKQLVADELSEKGFKEIQLITVTLVSDHRIVDGAVGAQWLKVLREALEDPESMIM